MPRTTLPTTATPFYSDAQLTLPVALYTVHALDKARAAGQFGDLLREIDHLERVPPEQFHVPDAAQASEARPVGFVLCYPHSPQSTRRVDFGFDKRPLFSIQPGQVAYFYVPTPEFSIVQLPDGTQRRMKTSEVMTP